MVYKVDFGVKCVGTRALHACNTHRESWFYEVFHYFWRTHFMGLVLPYNNQIESPAWIRSYFAFVLQIICSPLCVCALLCSVYANVLAHDLRFLFRLVSFISVSLCFTGIRLISFALACQRFLPLSRFLLTPQIQIALSWLLHSFVCLFLFLCFVFPLISVPKENLHIFLVFSCESRECLIPLHFSVNIHT